MKLTNYNLYFNYSTEPVEKFNLNRTFTNCKVTDKENNVVGLGVAILNPVDNFCRKTGRKIALKRALETLPKEIRKEIWKEYLEICGGNK